MDEQPIVHYKRGDTGPVFRSCCLDDETPVDLTSATEVRLLVRSRAGSTVVDQLMTKANQDSDRGWASYEWDADDLDTAGEYRGEVQVTWGDGTVQTFPANGYVRIVVHKDLSG